MPLAGILHHTPHPLWDSRRLWSLWDMITLKIAPFCNALRYLDFEIERARAAAKDPHYGAGQEHNKDYLGTILDEISREGVDALYLEGAETSRDEMAKFFGHSRGRPLDWARFADLLTRLRTDIDKEID